MTVDVARRTRRRGPKAVESPEPIVAPPASIAIGEIDQTIFECPSCSRPLALGARRCPGCGTRLVRGVALAKASGFVAAGVALGLVVGVGGGLLFGFGHGTSAPATAVGPTAAPVAGTTNPKPTAHPTAGASARPTALPTTDPLAIPPSARSALLQVMVTNERLSSSGDGLRAALDAPSLDASAVAQILRSMSADSVFAEQLAERVGAWSGSAGLGSDLATLYGSIHATAANGLVASVRNTAAYRTAATEMLRLLDQIPAIDEAVRSTAEGAGVVLLTAPGDATVP